RISKEWTANVYACFKPEVIAQESNDGRRFHRFTCAGTSCNAQITRYLDTGDASSTSNLRKHVKGCKSWGDEVLKSIDAMKDISQSREALAAYSRNGDITVAFKRAGKGKVTFSARQHTRSQTRMRPFDIVADRAFLSLMKTGRPEYWVPSPTTVARDVREVFARTRHRVGDLLNSVEGRLNFSSDGWTSPNHISYMGLLVHFEHEGQAITLPLDLVEAGFSHTGEALAIEF
ncbi:hypothetical protein BXZ70DRAFT_858951, partial [Cristinia sonorae]